MLRMSNFSNFKQDLRDMDENLRKILLILSSGIPTSDPRIEHSSSSLISFHDSPSTLSQFLRNCVLCSLIFFFDCYFCKKD
jgi:hypothetical protein